MANDAKLTEQILNLIDKSENILLLTHAKADCDGLGSMISMYLTLKALGKNVIASTNDPAPDNLSFLPSISIVQNSLKSVEDFIITLDVSRTPLKKIRYDLEEKENGEKSTKVNIVITPKSGHFTEKDVSFSTPEGENIDFDLIMTFDTGNLEHLGPLYDKNTELFFKTPLINIDHHASNTDFGQVNLVDVVAASTTEVMLNLLRQMEDHYDQTFIDEDIATLLLAGLITDTGSFQHANTSPNAMEVAAELLDLGARQQEIIKNIYKSKHLSTLKLWGVILSKVQSDPIYRMVWSSISETDLKESGANSDESEGIIDDLLSNAPGAEIIMLFKWNEEGYVSVSMRSTTNSADVGKIATDMGGGGHVRAAGFKIRDGKNLEEVMQMTLKKVKDYQGQRLNIHPGTVHQPVSSEGETSIKSSLKKQVSKSQPSNDAKTQVKYLDFDSLDAKDESVSKPLKKQDSVQSKDKKPKKAEPKISKPSEKTDDKDKSLVKKTEKDLKMGQKKTVDVQKQDKNDDSEKKNAQGPISMPEPKAEQISDTKDKTPPTPSVPEKKEPEKKLETNETPKPSPEIKPQPAPATPPKPDQITPAAAPTPSPVPDWLNPVKKEPTSSPAANANPASTPAAPTPNPSPTPFVTPANVAPAPSVSPATPPVTPTPSPVTPPAPAAPAPKPITPTPTPVASSPVSPASHPPLNPNAGTVQTNQNPTPSIQHPTPSHPTPPVTPPASNPNPSQTPPSSPANPIPPTGASPAPSPVPPPNPVA